MSKTPPYVGLLDSYPGAIAAYSLRKLTDTYTGFAIRVRHSVTNAILDVGFKADGTLDTVPLISFIGGNSGTIAIWYDQSGNGKNAEQQASNNQPHIIINGTLQTNNGKPSLYYDGASRYLDCGYLNGGAKPANYSTFINGNFKAQAGVRSLFASGDSGGNARHSYNQFGIHNLVSYKMFGSSGDGTNYRYWHTSNAPTLNTTYLFDQHYKSNTSPYLGQFYFNNTLQSVTDWLGGTAQQNSGTEFKTSIGRLGEANSSYFLGYVQEIVTYFSDQTANRAPIASNINSFYTIY
jgi:hypothetical protein